jgi:rSAM/selenodomain-associated transferase 1
MAFFRPGSVSTPTLMMFTRYPQPGFTKTRLIPHLGADGAAQLQRSMTEHLLASLGSMVNQVPLQLQVHFSGGSLQQMQNWLGDGFLYVSQRGNSLGARLSQAFRHNFEAGRAWVIAIGSDCPSMRAEDILHTLKLLQNHDLVLGPANDGGYYLIALRCWHPALFECIDWGTDQVLQQTIEIAHRYQLKSAFLQPLTDIDRPEDLPIWQSIQARKSGEFNNRPQVLL